MNVSLASHSSYGFSQHLRTFNPPGSASADAVADEHASRAYILPRRIRGDWVALGVMLFAACAIFFINLTASGYANEFLFSCGPGWLGQLEGLSLGVPGLRERHHRGQAAGSPLADGAFRAHLWSEFLCHPPAGSADGRGNHLPALCHRASILGQLGGHRHRLHLHAHSGSRAHVPLQQPRCLAGVIDDRCC